MQLCHRFTKTLFLLIFLLTPCLASEPVVKQQAASLIWMTEEYPPYNYYDGNGRLIGISVDLLLEIMRRMEIPFTREDIYVIPWARAYRETLNNPNAALFTMTLSDYRRDLFTFVGPIRPSKISIVTVNDKFKISSVADLSTLNVGTVRNDIGEQLLNQHGLSHVAKVKLPTSLEIIRMLLLKRIDAVAIDETIARFEFNRLGVDNDQFQIHMTLEDLTTHFAFNNQVSSEFIKAFSQAFQEVEEDGFLQDIFSQYGVQPD